MQPEHPISRRPPADPVRTATNPPSGRSASDGVISREAWRRILAAHVAPLPATAD